MARFVIGELPSVPPSLAKAVGKEMFDAISRLGLITVGYSPLTFNDQDFGVVAIDACDSTDQHKEKVMNFGQAVELLKAGKRVSRAGWNGRGMYLLKINGCNDLASLHGYGFGECQGEPVFADTVVIRTPANRLVAWVCSQEDMLAEDWEVA